MKRFKFKNGLVIIKKFCIKMKDQYSSNYDDPIVANERLKNKLDFLER
jgi:hypothetical protein